jgi:glycosyltransferase involved in cell wall biosynthesis
VVLESLASGVPVLAADAGALPELVEPGITGDRFRPGDAQDLGRKLGLLLAIALSLAAGSRARAQEHDLEVTLDGFERLILGPR